MKRMVEIFREVFQAADIMLVGDLVIRELQNWDSFNHINLMIAIEDTYGVVIMPDEMESVQTVDHLLDILRKKGCTIE